MTLLVSRCLLGESCRYDGRSCPKQTVCDLSQKHTLISVCPECDGGLPTPRSPAERIGDKVITASGEDVTQAYQKGALLALEQARRYNISYAILKAKSPSCGKGRVYDGHFTGTLRQGDGVTAQLLTENGIRVFTELEIDIIEEL